MYRILFITVLAALILSCESDEDTGTICFEPIPPCNSTLSAPIYFPGSMITGGISGYKNCLHFDATAVALIYDFDSLVGLRAETYSKQDHFHTTIKEVLKLKVLVNGTTPFQGIPDKENFTYTTYLENGEIEDSFRLDTTYPYGVTLYRGTDWPVQIWGSLNARFVLDQPSHGINPDTITFTNCSFAAYRP